MRVRVATFADQINMGRGLQTRVLDLSQVKHRQVVEWMDYDPASGDLVVMPTAQCGLYNVDRGVPLTPMHLRPITVIEAPPEKPKDAKAK